MKRLILLIMAVLTLAAPARGGIINPSGGPPSSGPGSGTVTSVTCGNGLSGGTITASGTCGISAPVSNANGGFGTTTYPSGNFNVGCSTNNSLNVGPSGANEATYSVFFQPTPFQFTNNDIYVSGATADATAETDGGIYQYSGTTLTLIADSGLIAWSNGHFTSALGAGTSNLATQPTATTCGSSGGNCSAGIWPPGYYAEAMSSVATTAKTRICYSTLVYASSFTLAATAGELPASITSVTLLPTNANGAGQAALQPW